MSSLLVRILPTFNLNLNLNQLQLILKPEWRPMEHSRRIPVIWE
jgi:hypothetical protein